MKVLNRIIFLIATGFGVGYIKKMPGTIGTLWGVLLFYLCSFDQAVFLAVLLVLFFLGIFTSSRVSYLTKIKDPGFIVIDEVVGFLIAVMFVPFSWTNAAVLFILFRIFDIAKPWPIKYLEKPRGGIGIMLDDVGAGIYSALSYRLILFCYALLSQAS